MMIIHWKNLSEIYKEPYTNGIIYSLYQYANKYNDSNLKQFFNNVKPEENDTIDDFLHSLDINYIYNKSGLKNVSVMLNVITSGLVVEDLGELVRYKNGTLVKWDFVISELQNNIIHRIISPMYGKKWLELSKTMLAEYDMLKPYDMTINDDSRRILDSSSSNNANNSGSENEISKFKNTTNEKFNNTDSSNANTYGFNSENEVPTDTVTNTHKSDPNGNITVVESQADGNSNNNTYSDETHSSGTYGSEEQNERDISRKGNIGNKSAMQLIKEQRDLLMFNLWEVIYNDLDSVLCRSTYSE